MQLGRLGNQPSQGASCTNGERLMFRVVAYVEDKFVGECLNRLAGLATQVETPQPVTNVVNTRGGLKAKTAGGTLCERYIDELRKTKLTETSNAVIRQWLVSQHAKPTSAPYIMKCLLNAGVVKKHPKKKGIFVAIFSTKGAK